MLLVKIHYAIVFPYPPGTGKETNESSWEEKPLKHEMCNDQALYSGVEWDAEIR